MSEANAKPAALPDLDMGAGPKLPRDSVVSKIAILGMSGSGKTQTARKLAETFMDADQHIVIFAPAAGWWGLRSSADGTGPGYPIAVFGGDHGDAPLRVESGATMAAAVLKHRFNAIFDMMLMSEPEMRRFTTDFLNVLNRRNRDPIHVFMDEFDILCPQQKSANSEDSRAAVNTTVRRGRINGIGSTMITQNPQDADKSVLNMADIVIAMRMAGSQAIDAVKRWVERNGSKEQMALMTSTLPSLPTGTGWIWAPQRGIFEQVQFPLCRTFDSSRTPSPGEKIRPPQVLAAVDMARLGKEIDAQVKEEQENSVDYLREEIARLKAAANAPQPAPEREDGSEMADLMQQIEELKTKAAEVEGLRERVAELQERDVIREQKLAQMMVTLQQIAETATEVVGRTEDELQQTPREISKPPSTVDLPTKRQAVTPSEGVTGPQQRILDALAIGRSIGRRVLSRLWVAIFADVSSKSSAFRNNLGALRTAGLIDYADDGVYLTQTGLIRTPAGKKLTEAETHSLLLEHLPPTQRAIMTPLLIVRGRTIPREQLAAKAGTSPTSSAFRNNLGALRSLKMLDYTTDRKVFAVEDLFWTKGGGNA